MKFAKIGIVLVIAAVILVIAMQRDDSDDKRATERSLQMAGLTPVTVIVHEQTRTFTATVDGEPGCTVSGIDSDTSDKLLLNGFEPDWYPRDSYNSPGMPTWPPRGVTVADVAKSHPQICNE